MPRTRLECTVLSVLLVTAACDFSVDQAVINDSAIDAGAEVDASGANGGGVESPGTGGSTGATTGSSTGAPIGSTGGGTSGGGSGNDAGARCFSDIECAFNGVCPCLPAGIGRPVSNGSRVCYGVSASVDQYGVPQDNAAVYAWDLEGAPVQIASSLPNAHALFIADGQCYFAVGAALMRAPLAGDSGAERVAVGRGDTLRAWPTPKHVWWSIAGQNDYELWRVERVQGAVPEQVTKSSKKWETGNSQYLFRFLDTNMNDLMAAPLSDLSSETKLANTPGMDANYGALRLVATEDAIYFDASRNVPGYFVRRIDLANPSAAPTYMNLSDPSPGGTYHEFFVEGSWFFWAVETQAPTGTYYRVLREPIDLSETAVEVAKIPRHNWLALVGNRLVFRVDGEDALTVRAIEGPPCDGGRTCPTGTSCGATKRCE